ncbi:MAG: ABC transporter ATP-binding protein/permease [Oscillospiraceae bacterium]|nr:ABC transporter ATP-binding protein/permease [Oscillospiraceae bacterium]
MDGHQKKPESTTDNSARRLQGTAMGVNHFGNVAEDVDSYGQTWKKLTVLCKKFLPSIALALLCAIVGTFLQLTVPGRLREMIDIMQLGITETLDIHSIIHLGIILAATFVIIAALNYLQSYIMVGVTAKISKKLRTDISRKINKLPLGYFNRVSMGDIISRVTNDVDTIGQTLNQNISMLLSSSVLFIGSLIMMLWTHWLMALIAIIASSICFFISKAVLKRSKKFFKAQQSELGSIVGHIDEIYSGHSIVRAYNGIDIAKKSFITLNKNLYNAAWRAQFVSGFITPLMSFSGSLAYVAVFVMGAALIIRNEISFGVIVAFIFYVNQFTQGLTHITETMPGLQSTTAASERVFQILDEEELSDETDKTQKLLDIKGNVTFENIKFGYEKEKPIVHDFSVSVKSGQKVAIVGPTGAGKTTLVNLLMRFYEPEHGTISIDGIPIMNITRAHLHAQFSMVLQDTWLFEGTVRENIAYNKKDVTDEDIVAVSTSIGLHHFITALHNGYDTILDYKTNLSEGQKQLIAIARAMLQNAPMLILDEATSSVDTRTEALVQSAMEKLMSKKTSFIIAHRLSTIKNADLILVLKDGDIIESGTHHALLSQNGFYAELFHSQYSLPA